MATPRTLLLPVTMMILQSPKNDCAYWRRVLPPDSPIRGCATSGSKLGTWLGAQNVCLVPPGHEFAVLCPRPASPAFRYRLRRGVTVSICLFLASVLICSA